VKPATTGCVVRRFFASSVLPAGPRKATAMVDAGRLGAVLRQARLRAGLSQEALAERARLSWRAISDLERRVKQSSRSLPAPDMQKPAYDTKVLLQSGSWEPLLPPSPFRTGRARVQRVWLKHVRCRQGVGVHTFAIPSPRNYHNSLIAMTHSRFMIVSSSTDGRPWCLTGHAGGWECPVRLASPAAGIVPRLSQGCITRMSPQDEGGSLPRGGGVQTPPQ
jgi:hypothetical protein